MDNRCPACHLDNPETIQELIVPAAALVVLVVAAVLGSRLQVRKGPAPEPWG